MPGWNADTLAGTAGAGAVTIVEGSAFCVSAANAAGTIIAPFCHGPAALLSAKLPDGSNAFAGRRLTVFTDEEERTGGTGENTPWWVESALREAGATIDSAAPWSDHVVVDGNLISGQNPQSSASVARRVVEALAG